MKLNQVFSGLLLTTLLVAGCKSTQSTTTSAPSPNANKEVLFTIDGTPYYTDEFVRVYNKNLDLVKDDSQKDLDNYLDLFIGYKLKVKKAEKLGLQEDKKYQGELKSYRTQLAKNYLTDTKVTDELIEEAYNRSGKEIKASHILFLADENASPADTLKAYNKAVEVRKKALAGEDFGKLAQQYSEDPSAKENKGDLGYFSVFRMVYPFENGAYNTPKGQISEPVRTRFGYHIIKVDDVRENRGDIQVAHIMLLSPKDGNPEDAAKVKSRIDEIYQKLQQGEDFSSLAKQFSDDKTSAEAGGELPKFSSGELTSTDFENQAFSLKNPGDITKPFKTQFGWHIIKLMNKYPVKTLEEVKPDFENRIRRDDRSKLIAASMTKKLREKYSIKTDQDLYAKVEKAFNDSLYSHKWSIPANADSYNKTLLTINNDKNLTGKEFLQYAHSQQRTGAWPRPLSRAVNDLYERYKDEQLSAYYNDNLENEFPEFAATMQEYRDGLLLFDLMEKEIWNKAKTDTIGLQKYYNAHKDNYLWKQRAEAEVFSSTDEKAAQEARKYLTEGKDAAFIKQKLNTGKITIMEKSGTFEKGSSDFPESAGWHEGISDVIKQDGYYYVVNEKKVLPAGPKSFEESKGRVINDYQQYLENTWVDDLKKEFTIKVNQDVFEKVKKELNQ
ncbi:peptidylprolyl isomerase [Flavobacterium rhizosphaerae]|uniref:Peptidylprolyl isomerase n=1 Tax=Flavobacterium rhizosphaerae TaxID=3163298 RepID=A0ABW8Z096_9FLAO